VQAEICNEESALFRSTTSCLYHRVTTCHRSWRHRRLETERWPPL